LKPECPQAEGTEGTVLPSLPHLKDSGPRQALQGPLLRAPPTSHVLVSAPEVQRPPVPVPQPPALKEKLPPIMSAQAVLCPVVSFWNPHILPWHN
jgi:hypothetical protein